MYSYDLEKQNNLVERMSIQHIIFLIIIDKINAKWYHSRYKKNRGVVMNIGIIVHSQTGNTFSVAEKLKESMEEKGHSVHIERVTAVKEQPAPNEPVELKDNPDISIYDALVFCAPVHAFSLSAVMQAYLKQVQSMENKKVNCFVTQQLKFSFMGGNRSVNQMKKACIDKGASFGNTGIVNWSSKKRDELINTVVEDCGKV